MRKIEGFAVRKLGEETVIVAESVDLIDFDRIISLNSSAAYIWESLPINDFSVETVVELLTERYDVSPQEARNDAKELLRIWLEAGIIEE